MTDCVIGVDIGGTKCAAGIVRLSGGQIITQERFPTQANLGGQALLNAVTNCLAGLLKTAASNGLNVQTIGLGLAELVGPEHQILSRATIDWTEIDVLKFLSTIFEVPVFLEADVRAAALAEANWGAGQAFDPFLYVTVGTGISSCLVLDRKPYLGARGLTGTFASSRQLIPGDHDDLGAGPALETYAAGPALASRYRAYCPTFDGQAPAVLRLADNGDRVAQQIVQSAGRALGASIAHLVNCLDPAAIVLGGGLGLTEGYYRSACESAMREFIWSDLHRNVPLRTAKLREDAGWIGAALNAAKRAGSLSVRPIPQ